MDGWLDGMVWMVGGLDECDNPLSRSVRRNFSPFPKSPFLSVNRGSIRYGFHVGAK